MAARGVYGLEIGNSPRAEGVLKKGEGSSRVAGSSLKECHGPQGDTTSKWMASQTVVTALQWLCLGGRGGVGLDGVFT